MVDLPTRVRREPLLEWLRSQGIPTDDIVSVYAGPNGMSIRWGRRDTNGALLVGGQEGENKRDVAAKVEVGFRWQEADEADMEVPADE